MKWIFFLALIAAVACTNTEVKQAPTQTDTLTTTPATNETIQVEPDTSVSISKTYGNKRFKEVTAEKLGPGKYLIKGQGQIFEANFGWVVEDGHEELQKGFQMTDAGAPEWGKFEFTLEVQKKREQSTLTLILFESSAMDGSRQYELPITLE